MDLRVQVKKILAAAAFGWFALAVTFPLRAQTMPATITVNAASTITSFAPLSIFGTNLAYWVSQTNNSNTQAAVQAAGNYFLRYPGGSSSDDYHWNGTGAFDANHHWVPSGTAWSNGFVGNETHCGTTGSNNAGTHPYSYLVDGSTATTWLSNADTNFPNHQFAYLDLTRANSTVNVSAVSIVWGTPYATSYEVQYWNGASNATPYKANSEANWVDLPGGNITGASGGTTVVTFTTAEATRFVRVLMTASSAGAGGAYAIAEIYALNGAALIGTNTTNYQTQPLAVVSSTDPACTLSYTTSPPGSFDFGSYMTYVHQFTPAAVPLITVNFGTGTPAEAASWVYYANTVKGYGIKYWQVGNEMDGIWETGGPFRADDYAYRFTEYYNAMTAVDPTIILTGPVVGGPNNNSNAYDGLTYIQTFLNTMQTLGKTADIGAVDFHWYVGSTTASAALGTPSQMSTFAANLNSWIASAGVSPTIPILMSETNVNAGTPLLMNQLPTGLWLVNWLGEFIHYFGPGGHANLWDTMNGSSDLTTNTIGDQGYLDVEATYVNGGTTYANPYQYQPRANYWAMQMMATDWAIAGDSSAHQLVSATSSAATLVSYADYRPDGILSLVVVNKDPTNSYITNLNVGPFVPNTTANSWTFNANNYAWETTTIPYHASPDTAPTTAVMTGVASSFPVTFSPYSINVIQFTNSGVPTSTATNSPSPTASKTPSNTPTVTLTKTPTASPTNSPTLTPTLTPTDSPAPTLTWTPTFTPTATLTNTSCVDGLGNTCTFSPTPQATDTPTSTPTNSPTSTVTVTSTPTVVTIQASQGSNPPNGSTQAPGASGVTVQQIQLTNPGGNSVTLSSLTLTETGASPTGITSVSLLKNGTVIATASFTGSTATFNFTDTLLANGGMATYQVMANFSNGASLGTYSFSVTGGAGTNGQPVLFANLPVIGAAVTIAAATATPTNSPTNSPTMTFTPTQSPTPTSTPGLTGIFPNPVTGGNSLQLTYQLGQAASEVKVKIFTLAFRKIYEDDSLPTAPGGQLYVFNWNRVGSVADGLYYVVLDVKTGGFESHQVMKLLIQR